jgi:hypothetical protein
MAWEGPREDDPVWCAAADKADAPTAESVSCTQKNPSSAGSEMASLTLPGMGAKGLAGDVGAAMPPAAPSYQKFTSQMDMGHFLEVHYKIRTPKDLTSCEVCHR